MTHVLVVQHEENAGIGLLGERLNAAGIEVKVVGPGARQAVPDTPAGFDGVIVLGGTPGPTDDDEAPWLPQVRSLIRGCLEAEVPYLGICLGAQLLAVTAGGDVLPAIRPEVGLTSLQLTASAADDPLFGVLSSSLVALQWHFLEIAELPDGSESLCSSALCRNQAFRVGPVAWGTQFHVEALTSTAVAWSRDHSHHLQAVGLLQDDIVTPVAAHEGEMRHTWSAFADRWAAIVVLAATTESSRLDDVPAR